MGLTIREISPANRRDVDRFILMVEDVFADDPAFVPPLQIERRDVFDPRKNPFWKYAEVAMFLAERDGQAVGRITAHINHVHDEKYGPGMGFFGFADFVDDPEVASLLAGEAERWLRSRGIKRIRGPVSFDMQEEAGFLVDGFEYPPYMMTGHSLPHCSRLFEGMGYSKAKDLFAWKYIVGETNELTQMMVEEGRKIEGLTIRSLDMKNLRRDVKNLTDIYNDAWASNWGSTPVKDDYADKVAKDMRAIAEPSIIIFAEYKGDTIAVAWAMRNVNEVLKRMGRCHGYLGAMRFLWHMRFDPPKTGRLLILGIKKKYRGGALRTLSVLLYHEMHMRGKAIGLTEGELSWTLEDNEKINRGIELMGGKKYKTYRILEKEI